MLSNVLLVSFQADVLTLSLVLLPPASLSLSFHTSYILAPVIRQGCPLCVQMNNSLTERAEMCHAERMSTSDLPRRWYFISEQNLNMENMSKRFTAVLLHHMLYMRLQDIRCGWLPELNYTVWSPFSCSWDINMAWPPQTCSRHCPTWRTFWNMGCWSDGKNLKTCLTTHSP